MHEHAFAAFSVLDLIDQPFVQLLDLVETVKSSGFARDVENVQVTVVSDAEDVGRHEVVNAKRANR
ncbi:hypothetical protein D3C85_1862040 [compost metagenome]